MVGTKLGPYDIQEEVGRGGMATVYRAYHAATDRIVAIKVMRASFVNDPDTLSRFQREARLIAKLEHPHLLPVYDFDGTHQTPYIVMRYLDCGTLKDILRRGCLPLRTAIHVLGQVASALDYAHRQGVIHRDIKPSNIMIDGDGNAFLADFGLARVSVPDQQADVNLTLPGTVLGTPSYMSPEQAMGRGDLDQRADIYSLGVVLFEMITGRLPFVGEHPVVVAMAHVNRPVPRASAIDPALPPALDAVLEKAMGKSPSDRYGSASEFSRAAAQAVGLSGPDATSPTFRPEDMVPRPRGEHREPSGGAPPASPEERTKSDSQATPSERRKLVTVLHVNLAELAEYMAEEDPESSGEALERLWGRLEGVVQRLGGRIENRAADTALVLWGADVAREDDAERAVRAAVEMQATLGDVLGDRAGASLPMQIGVTTGHVLLSPDRATGRLAASGSPIILAGRLERAAPAGRILISQDTYRHVREAFELEAHTSVQVLERKAPLETYIVKRPRAGPRGGAPREASGRTFRQVELEVLKRAFLTAGREGKTQVVTVLGAPGLGKGRLLDEFNRWLSAERLPFTRMAGSATQEATRQPYSVVRSLFAEHFNVRPGEGVDVLRGRVTLAMAPDASTPWGVQAMETVQFLSRWLGSVEEGPLTSTLGHGTERFRENLVHHMGLYFMAAARRAPVVLELSDLQWADEGSIAALSGLFRESPRMHLVALCLGRQELLERAPRWGTGFPAHTRLELEPLSRQESAALVDEILSRVPDVPTTLRDLIVERAEGNPLYIEELVQVLVEDGVVMPGESQWRVDLARLTALHVPTTLAGLIQARLEGLHPVERTVLQRASVVGRTFWDGAAEALAAADGAAVEVAGALESLVRRGLVEAKEVSILSGVREFSFTSNILKEVVLEAVPKRLQRAYSAQAAQWLAERFRGRSSEWAAAIGEHYHRAGESAEAARYMTRAGEQAIQVSAFEDARGFLDRALSLLREGGASDAQEASVRLHLAEALWKLGDYPKAKENLAAAMAKASRPEDSRLRAEVLYHMAQVALSQGELESARRRFEESLDTADLEDQVAQGRALFGLGEVAWRSGDQETATEHLEAALILARQTSDSVQVMDCLHRLGSVARSAGDLETARAHMEESRAQAIETGSRDRLAAALDGLGEVLKHQGDLGGARECFQESLALAEAIGLHMAALWARTNLAFVEIDLGDKDEARSHLRQSLRQAREHGESEGLLCAVLGFAALRGGASGAALAAEALRHPAANASVRECAAPLLPKLGLTPAILSQRMGAVPDLDALAKSLLGDEK